MKRLIYGLYAFFIVLMVFTFIMAAKYHDDVVEKGYYEKSKSFFKDREREENEGIVFSLPDTVSTAEKELILSIEAAGDGEGEARGTVRLFSVSSRKAVGDFSLLRKSKNIYTVRLGNIPPGKYLASLEVHLKNNVWRRKWFIRVE